MFAAAGDSRFLTRALATFGCRRDEPGAGLRR
jgi:hypothetical protein